MKNLRFLLSITSVTGNTPIFHIRAQHPSISLWLFFRNKYQWSTSMQDRCRTWSVKVSLGSRHERAGVQYPRPAVPASYEVTNG